MGFLQRKRFLPACCLCCCTSNRVVHQQCCACAETGASKSKVTIIVLFTSLTDFNRELEHRWEQTCKGPGGTLCPLSPRQAKFLPLLPQPVRLFVCCQNQQFYSLEKYHLLPLTASGSKILPLFHVNSYPIFNFFSFSWTNADIVVYIFLLLHAFFWLLQESGELIFQ